MCIGTRVKQLRGRALEAELARALVKWRSDVVASGKLFVYTQAGFSRVAGVSRETIRCKQSCLDLVLAQFEVTRPLADGSVGVKIAAKKYQELLFKYEELVKKHEALRAHHLSIYKMLLRNNFDLGTISDGVFK